MKILSWNIGGGHIFKGKIETGLGYEEENINYFIDKIDSTKCDIIGLQESHTSFDGESSQSEIIASSLDYHFFNYPYDKSHIKKGELLSLVNLSKFHIINSRYELLPNPGLEIVRPNGDIWKTHDKGFLISEIDCEGLKINFVNGHLFPFHHFKRSFMEPEFNDLRKFISDLIITLKDAPTIVAVDINFNDLSVLLPDIFTQGEFKETFTNIETAPGFGQQDHILISKHWTHNSSEVIKTDSDHYPCIVDISYIN